MSVAPLLRGLRVIDAASDIADYRWFVDNRAKRGIALDLRQPEGRADVFVTTAAPKSTPQTPRHARASIGALNA